MKKLLGLLIFCLILTGCSSTNINNKVDSTTETQASEEKVSPTNIPTSTPTVQDDSQNETTDNTVTETETTQSPVSDDAWFVGAIGSAKIHAKLDILDNHQVSGIYYYDKYKTNINLTGTTENIIKDYTTLYTTEDTEEQGQIIGVYKTTDYIEGYWKSGDKVLPMYLIKEGSNTNPPNQPSEGTMQFSGQWTGIISTYFVGGSAKITALFDDMIYYDIFAHNGTNMGEVDSLAFVQDNTATTVFEERIDYNDGKSDHVKFQLSIKNKNLTLDSNKYDFWCGFAVSYDNAYTKGNVEIPFPTAKDVGIVDSEEKAELFKKLVGTEYENFIQNTQYVTLEELTLDGETIQVGESYLRGYSGMCYYIVSKDYLYAAINNGDSIKYYTNDPAYASQLPKPMVEWNSSNLPVEYNYAK